MKRIHIVGCSPRSGTTLLTEMMIAGFHIDVHTDHESRITKIPPRRGRVYLTKAPRDILVIDAVLKLMPELYVIYMIRDPRDLVCSRHRSDPDRYWTSLKFWKVYTPVGRKLADHPRFITLKYEDIVRRPDHIQDVIMERMPFLEKIRLFSTFHHHRTVSVKSDRALGGLRAVSTASIGNWKNHLSRIKDQVQKHGSITDDLIEFGYERDASWERVLDDVTAVDMESHWSEYPNSKKLDKILRWRYFHALRARLANTSPAILIAQLKG